VQITSKSFSGLYEKLSPVDSALYNSYSAPSGCLQGTRTAVLEILRDWALSSATFGVFWLAGTAGTGKTTIAKTFCDQMASEGILGASFFISRQDEARRDPRNIIRTLAYDLAALNTCRVQSVWDNLVSAPNLTSLHIVEQARRLLANPPPLQQFAGYSTIIVIDALDESTENDNSEGEGLISLLVSVLEHQAVKLLITSRDEPRISIQLDGLAKEMVKLHRMEQSIVSRDIRAFYETRFHQLIESRRINLPGWPSPNASNILTNRTGYLFVYAAIIVKFVSAQRFDPIQRLRSILNSHHEPFEHHVVFQPLDMLYAHILNEAVIVDGTIDEQLQHRVKMLVETVIILQRPLQLQSIAALLMAFDDTFNEAEIQSDLESLASVIPTPEKESDPVEIFHPSFPDYMQDPKRCKDPHLTISSTDAHLHVAMACLRLMNGCLQKDVCNIKDFTVENAKITDLQKRLDDNIPESLRYTCTYWISHVVSASPVQPLIKELKEFCENHLLHWIEVLSLLESLGAAYHGLPRTLEWCQVSPRPTIIVYIV
jgi:hypothetical protein